MFFSALLPWLHRIVINTLPTRHGSIYNHRPDYGRPFSVAVTITENNAKQVCVSSRLDLQEGLQRPQLIPLKKSAASSLPTHSQYITQWPYSSTLPQISRRTKWTKKPCLVAHYCAERSNHIIHFNQERFPHLITLLEPRKLAALSVDLHSHLTNGRRLFIPPLQTENERVEDPFH